MKCYLMSFKIDINFIPVICVYVNILCTMYYLNVVSSFSVKFIHRHYKVKQCISGREGNIQVSYKVVIWCIDVMKAQLLVSANLL